MKRSTIAVLGVVMMLAAAAQGAPAVWSVATVHGYDRFSISGDGEKLTYDTQPQAHDNEWYWFENNGYPSNILATHSTASGPANHPNGKTTDPVRAGCRTFAVTDVAEGQELDTIKLEFEYNHTLGAGITTVNFFLTDGAGKFGIFAPTTSGLTPISTVSVVDDTWTKITIDMTNPGIGTGDFAVYEHNGLAGLAPNASYTLMSWADIKDLTIAGMYDFQRSPTLGWGHWGTMFNQVNMAGSASIVNGYGLALIRGDTVGGVGHTDPREIRNVTVSFGGVDYTGTFENGQLPEPATMSVLALGAVGLMCRRRK